MAAGAMLIALQGCGDNTLTDEGALTGSDAAMIVAGALGSGNSTAGLTSQLEEAVTFATGGGLRRTGAGSSTSVVLLDTTLTRTRTGLYSYDYWFHLVFEAPAPNTLNHRYDMRGTFDTPRLASDDTAHAELTITDLTAPALTFNGAYTRLGTQLFKLRQENNAFSSRIVAQLTDLTVEKSTKKVTAGVMDAVLTGGFENGSTFEITAKVTFLGNDQATVVINGKSYQVDLATATVTPL
jgi:hypothetical protein